MSFGNLWDFKSNGELKVIKSLNKVIGIKTFFDVGANSGKYFLCAAEILESAKVDFHLFEPSPSTFKILETIKSGNHTLIKNQIALGKEVLNKVDFYSHKIHTLSGIYSSDPDSSKLYRVKMNTIDNYCTTHEIGKIDFLKIDVEGHEFDVLLGAIKSINSGKISAIQFEFGVNNMCSRTYFKDFYTMLSSYYDIFLIQKGGLIPIYKYEYELESFGKVSNYLAVLRSIKYSW